MPLGLSARNMLESAMRQTILVVAAVLITTPVFAGLEQAASLAGSAFQSSLSFKPARFKTADMNDEDTLIALLGDNDASVRAGAARSLKGYALTSYKTENALLERAKDQREQESVRREAIKSLSFAAQHWNTRDALLELAKSDRETTALRAITLKSLYVMAGDSTVKETFFDILGGWSTSNPTLRAAALWAMMGAAGGDYDTKSKLLETANSPTENVVLRIEAIRSMYLGMGDWNLRDAVLRLAQDERQTLELRKFSILVLNAINQDWTVKEYLQKEASEERNGALRATAIQAMQVGPDMQIVRLFHLSFYAGRFVDPLEDQ